MATIRTSNIAAGTFSPSGTTTVTVYTVPAGYHVKLSALRLFFNAGATFFSVSLRKGGSTPVVHLRSLAPTTNQAIYDSIADVLEAGDTITMTGPDAVDVVFWISGTVYLEP